MSPFCRFLVSFSVKYDVTDAMLQDIEKMKVQYLMSLLFDLFEILQAVRSKQLNFVAMATQKGKNWPLFKNKRLLFSYNKQKCITHFSSKLDPTCSRNQTVEQFEHCFCLNNRCFVFSTVDNNFDSGWHSNKI